MFNFGIKSVWRGDVFVWWLEFNDGDVLGVGPIWWPNAWGPRLVNTPNIITRNYQSVGMH